MKNLLTKLLLVQKEIKPIIKDESNPFFKSKYFDINGLLSELKPILSKHGIVVLQPIGNKDGCNTLSTVVYDSESGDEMWSTLILPKIDDVQKFGAAVTYYRRYALQSLFLLEAEDDDGNSAVQKPAPAATTTGTTKVCMSCSKDFTPKKGTEAFAKNCYACFIAAKMPGQTEPVAKLEDEPPF